MEQVLFTVVDAAKALNISRAMVYVLINEGRIKTVKIGRSRRIHIDALKAFVKSLEEEARV